MTKKERNASRSRRQTQKAKGGGKKLSDRKSHAADKERVIVKASQEKEDSQPIEVDTTAEEEQEQVDSESESGVVSEPVVQRPIFNIKQSDFVQLTPELASRLLHPNPCCFLTTIPSAADYSTGKADVEANAPQKLNAMTLSWLTPANNYGGFVFVIHKTRFSANCIVNGSGKFTLSVAHAGLTSVLLSCGKVCGRTTDKFSGGAVVGLKEVTSSKLCASNDRNEKFTASNVFSALGNDSDSDDSDNDVDKKVHKQFELNDRDSMIASPVQGTVAHMSCRVLQHSDAADAGHWLVTAQIEDAYVHTSYWDGKCFEPRLPDLPPLVSFLGSQRFGFMMSEDQK